jgi:hypothetical protein
MTAAAWPCFAEDTRVTNPNAVLLEVGGRGILYSVNYDRVVSEDLAFGIGYGSGPVTSANGVDTSQSVSLIPVYVNLYLMRDQGSLYVTGGADFVTNPGSIVGYSANQSGVVFQNTSIMPTFGVGYENRSDAGFLVRATGYVLVASNVKPWAGFSIGYSF